MPTRVKAQFQERADREGRGTRRDESYTAYIQVRRGDLASHGRSHYVPSILTSRHHDVLSDLELHVLWHLQQLDPAEIREGMPLLWEGVEPEFTWTEVTVGTLEIAKLLGVRHPMLSEDAPFRMTTDFLVTLRGKSHVAVHVKYWRELDDERNVEMRRIEEEYWRRRGVSFKVITEEDLNRTAIGNLAMFSSVDQEVVGLTSRQWLAEVAALARFEPMNTALEQVATTHGHTYGVAVNRIKMAVLKGHLRLDLTRGVLRWDEVWPAMVVTDLANPMLG
ncbi:MAG: Tn7 transposase TnsA N-terminal domain-containing protein [Piscinibacter sp.]|uniref:TnsA endonuclease N-terminal domain-containing protein n=1 Tax=Piscinibacter sp. TaxID=1903157 RepID=UPI002585343F|nr:TnsA endonuclease N-terminal domain-containing protein [Piscinibacter sp.]MCW5667831.1 Tn7 transposase TnsA N-terminal domain-containing protein [Piscinibacter sp.]